jgi:hypothetical protein
LQQQGPHTSARPQSCGSRRHDTSSKCSHHSTSLYTAAPYGTHSRLHSQHRITLWTAPTSHAHAISYCALHPPPRPIAPYCGRSRQTRSTAQHGSGQRHAVHISAQHNTTPYTAPTFQAYSTILCTQPYRRTAQHSTARLSTAQQHTVQCANPAHPALLCTQPLALTTQHNTAPHRKLQHLTGHSSSHPHHSISLCSVPTSPKQAVSNCAHSRTAHSTARLSAARQHNEHCAHVPGKQRGAIPAVLVGQRSSADGRAIRESCATMNCTGPMNL